MPPKRFGPKTIAVRHVLIVPFAVLAALGVMLVAFFSIGAGQQAVKELVADLGRQTLREIRAEVTVLMEIPLLVNYQNDLALSGGLFSLDQVAKRNRYFAGQMLSYPLISYSFIGLEDGEFYGARRNEVGGVELIENNARTGGASWYYAMAESRDALEKLVEIPNFDCRTRPWYQAAKEEQKALYSPIYRHFVYKDLAITAAMPYITPDGSFGGVFGVDFRLDSINNFLGTLPNQAAGVTFIVERSTGMLIGNSLNMPNYRNAPDGSLERLGPADVGNDSIGLAYQYSIDHPVQSGDSISLGGPDGPIQLNIMDFRLANLDWVIFVLIPERAFMGPVLQNVETTIILVALFLLAAIAVGFWVSQLLFGPLTQLVRAAGELEAGNLDFQVSIGPFSEWAVLSHAFNTMAKRLSSTINMQEALIVQRTAELALKNHELQEANQSKDRFFSIVAHDLRGPVGSLAFLLETLSQQKADSDPALLASTMEQAAGYTRGIHEFLETLLTWALSQQGKLECHPQAFAMSQVQEGVANLFMQAAAIKGLTLGFEPCHEEVFADPDMVKTIIRNLVSNAIKFTTSGGHIQVSHRVVDHLLAIEVSDTGIGIAPETLKVILSIDKKRSMVGTAGERGHGLGLILCKDFVERNGGTIQVRSVEGEGTTVVFTLPLARE